MRFLRVLLLLCIALSSLVYADIEYNTINEDGSFQFRHKNDDIGAYYHSASGTPDNIVRGRYGSRNRALGQVEETVYTAGPRGFRVNGPKIHRKMDLAQFPVQPRGSIDDPLADPFDDPSYNFKFRASDHSRSENNDATGRVTGLYSFIDDVGERHSVRYAAGAGTGYEVINSVPDNPANVGYSNPLYKAHPATRGKMSVQRGPLGSYKLIAAGPDHRRAESRGSDGYVRGTYSFLDDKGVQRTVEYIAGAGIGYRVLHNTVGPGTHINPTTANFRLTDTDFQLANDFGSGVSGGNSGGGIGGGNRGREHLRTSDGDTGGASEGSEQGVISVSQDENSVFSGSSGGQDQMGPREISIGGAESGGSSGGGIPGGDSGGDRRVGSSTIKGRNGIRMRPGNGIVRVGTGESTRSSEGGSSKKVSISHDTGGGESGGSGSGPPGYLYDPPSGTANNYNLNDDDVVGSLPPLVTTNHRIHEFNRQRDWVQRHRDSTIIKNVGKWHVALPPGHSVRAHVQNIDLVPLGGRILSPSEALRQDEIADLAASREH